MFEMALSALAIVFDPSRLTFVALGVVIGLSLGVIPGLSGIVGLSLLLPFTFDMDPFTALAFLVGLQAVVATSDTIPAVLFGVPGTVGSASTILDGHPMAKQGLAARAFGAAFSASVLGGLFGALFLALCVPLLRPFILSFGSPELLAFCVFGLSLIGVLSGGNPLKGLAGAGLGLVIATVGEEPNTAIERWTFGSLYLLDGIPLVPLALGLFALPEIADMAIAGRTMRREHGVTTAWGQLAGVRDTLSSFSLVLRGSGIGSVLGAVPGIGAPVIPWIAYGHAMRTEKGAAQTFGKGDVRGVIASESSNNAKEGGALVSTIAFGVPATAAMALLLGAFLIHGLSPGPDMLTSRLDVTYTLVWTVALANVLGCGICFVFARQLAGIARVRVGILAPVVLSITFIGAFQATRQWGDLVALLGFGLLGWVMKRVDWPRPPLLLGLVLGGLLERYMFISFQRYGTDWLSRPIVIGVFLVTAYSLLKPVVSDLLKRRHRATDQITFGFRSERIDAAFWFNVAVIGFFSTAIIGSWQWDFGARLVPQVVGWLGLCLAGWQLAWRLCVTTAPVTPDGALEPAEAATQPPDGESELGHLSAQVAARRAVRYFGWCFFILAAAMLMGLLPAMLVFLLGYLRMEAREGWKMTLAVGLGAWVIAYLLFHQLLRVPWPTAVLGDLLPGLRSVGLTNLL
ncbi:MAG: tripartite tricarboxylate transporter permease [Rhodospirillaceae bacterium]|nr:tripartite tricarboxylate transporter permease [Rhodospirillaceae bacterium]